MREFFLDTNSVAVTSYDDEYQKDGVTSPTFPAGCLAPASGRQMLPGVIVIPEGACPATKPMPNGGDYASPPGGGSLNRAPGAPVKGGGGGEPTKFTVQTIATVARELLEKGAKASRAQIVFSTIAAVRNIRLGRYRNFVVRAGP